MRRSYSHTYLNSQVSPQLTLPPQNIVLEGNLVRKVPDRNASLWNGMALCDNQGPVYKKSEMRWKEFETSKRTIDPSLNHEYSTKVLNTYTKTPSASLTDMINRGFSRENLGNLNKRVMVSGKSIYTNAMSYENINATESLNQAYKDKHPGHCVQIERRQKKSTAIGEERNVSQISTLPGYHREVYEEPRPVKIKPDYTSSINELPGFLKNPVKDPEPPNPYIKFTRNTATTVEKTIFLGPQKEKNGPRQEIIPYYQPESSDYGMVGKESDVRSI